MAALNTFQLPIDPRFDFLCMRNGQCKFGLIQVSFPQVSIPFSGSHLLATDTTVMNSL